jgi:hypothetical protein
MAEKSTKKPTIYRVLRPIPPSAEAFGEGDQRMTYDVVGDFEAGNPNDAVEQAADTIPGDTLTLVAVPVSYWQMRSLKAKTMRIWEVAREGPGAAEPSGENPAS